jgi:hypothetical protein
MEDHIPLNRQFSPVSRSQEEAEESEILSAWGRGNPKSWDDLEREFRCVILAEAGAGKTEEFRHHAKELASRGKPAFFIRIEYIEVDFYTAFEVGDEDLFRTWAQSTEEAWFFLDSVDEARLKDPRDFERAIRRFAKGINKAAHRAHIYISSRPYAWRPEEDRRLLDEILFQPAAQQAEARKKGQQAKPQSALTIYILRHLDRERIRRFCRARSAKDVDGLLHAIERCNIWGLAERPFDLEGVLAKWDRDSALGSRIDLLRHNIDKRLSDAHCTDRAQRQPLNLEQARQGARRLAAAVVQTGLAGINVPDAASGKPGFKAECILDDWNPEDVRALLERGIFNDVIYGAVRFRHREVRELLAAEWFHGLLQAGNSRHSVEALFFREKYGEKIITPRLRPILSWLILFDDEMRHRAIKLHPEIAVEGGDPSGLPLVERKRILADIVRRIGSNETARSAQENSAIARIANPDLAGETQQLINEYINNDDAIFFLGRLVWQGRMGSCIEPFLDIAIDGRRGIYARRISARAVMTCGSAEQKQRLWQSLNESGAQIPRELLAELVAEAEADRHSVEYLLISLGKLPSYEPFKTTGLGHSLHAFVQRLSTIGDQLAIRQLLDGVHTYLNRPPFIQPRLCRVSKEYAWLLKPTTHAVERLVESQSSLVFGRTVLSIMLMVAALRRWHDNSLHEYKGNLQVLVPGWPELNDALYWASIEEDRSAKAANTSELLSDDCFVFSHGHFWNFDAAGLLRLLDCMRSRALQDDKSYALSTAFRVYVQADRPADLLSHLQDAVSNDPDLQEQLDRLLNPPASETMRRYEQECIESRHKREEEEQRMKRDREMWIAELRTNPDRVNNPPNLKPGGITDDQYWLMIELQNSRSATGCSEYANWQALIPDFGEAVAHAYRAAADKHWRHYLPKLRSEGIQSNRNEYPLLFARAGLEIEAAENPEFPDNLAEVQVHHALRYITCEPNGFPNWLERMYQAYPDLVKKAVANELLWELENTGSEERIHYILHDLVYHAPWLHAPIAPVILDWIEANPTRFNINQQDCLHVHYCLRILANGGTDTARLAEFVRLQLAQADDPDSISTWYAVLVDCEPKQGIPEVDTWLSGLDEEKATHAAQIFVTTLLGGSPVREGGLYFGRFREADYLKSLYISMHRYIRANEDINRAGGGVYSPGLRDHAQDARNRLFKLLTELPGKASYTAMKQLVQDHPDPDHRPWMAKQAYQRAEEDGDLENWTAKQVSEFYKSQIITPATHRQLFDLAVRRLLDLKNWLERGNDSPWQTWRRPREETEMRTLIAGWLNQQSRGQYTTAQEPELANSQRMDIWLQNTNVDSPVPIELKLLDKNWTGPELCERLRNQLVGDYLREESARCGVMLLVWQGQTTQRHWEINGRRVGLDELANALKMYWEGIADEFPGVDGDGVDVIVIDLTQRGQVSDS